MTVQYPPLRLLESKDHYFYHWMTMNAKGDHDDDTTASVTSSIEGESEPSEKSTDAVEERSTNEKHETLAKVWLQHLKVHSATHEVFSSVDNYRELPEIVYNASRDDHDFWRDIKRSTLGTNHWMKLLTATSSINRAAWTPVQYGGVKCTDGGCAPDKVVSMGAYGEWWVGKNVIAPWLGSAYYDTPGKICHADMPILTTTPDYTFLKVP
ncbi:hypothetical protein ElyMa_004525500 [Elysia marginata]|uniref:Uncharacterized protein n=1 Tax=Elysia marginata TaxID=1093978 RepID=A0AAV4HQI4_9GAST|nr:hypothetical protein ElyMa_004525500 [Elysia marginata]